MIQDIVIVIFSFVTLSWIYRFIPRFAVVDLICWTNLFLFIKMWSFVQKQIYLFHQVTHILLSIASFGLGVSLVIYSVVSNGGVSWLDQIGSGVWNACFVSYCVLSSSLLSNGCKILSAWKFAHRSLNRD